MSTNPMRVYAATEADLIKDLAEELGGRIGDHAGRFETSLLDVLLPGSVDIGRLPRLDEVPPTSECIGRLGPWICRDPDGRPSLRTDQDGFQADGPGQFIGVAGEDPRLASKDFGERAIRAIVGRMHDKAEELLAEYPGGKL